jgi:iron complex outermembrane recepter protein
VSVPALAFVLLAAGPASAQAQTTLEPTMVTATRFPELLATLPLGVSVITADEIRASGAATVNEAVMRLLGVPGRGDFYGNLDYGLDLRGFGSTSYSNQVVILDGVRINDADLSSPRLSSVNVDSVERIEVLRGNGAVIYGEGATGGVIVITTKAGLGRKRSNTASLYAGFGTHNLQDNRINATLAQGGFSLDLVGQTRRTDNHRDNFRSKSDGVSVNVQWSDDSLRFGARFSRDSLNSRLPGAITSLQFLQNPRVSNNPNDFASIDAERISLFSEWLVDDWEFGADIARREQSSSSFLFGGISESDVTVNTLGFRAKQSKRLTQGLNTLVIGHEINDWGRNATFFPNDKQDGKAWFVKNDFTWSNGIRASGGLRNELIDRETGIGGAGLGARESLNAWELGLSGPLLQGGLAWVRAGTSYRVGNFDELAFKLPTALLLPQESRDFEAGWRLDAKPYRLELRAYRSRIRNEIAYDPNIFENTNFDPTTRSGLEADADWAVNSQLNLGLRLGLRKSVFRSGPYAGLDVPLAPKRTVALRADWTPAAGHRLSGGVNWVSSQAADLDNQCRIPSYTTVDARYSVKVRAAEFSLGVGNLFDRSYFTQAFGCAGSNATSLYPEPGRTFTAAVRMQF